MNKMLSERYDRTVLARFATLMDNGQLAHAYLFVGPQNIGKSVTALAVAKLVNCENPAGGPFCGLCPSCRKIDGGNHPDVMTLDREDKQVIRIARVRDLIGRMQLKPFEARKKVFIIKNVEDLTPEGANALLKTLEEPPGDALLILTTAVPERNLDTVRSRCHTVTFFPLTDKELAQRLEKDYAVSKKEAHFLAGFAQGALGKAQRLSSQGFFAQKNRIINAIVFDRHNESYLKSLAADRDKTKEALDLLLSWFRDLALLKAGAVPGWVVHGDRMEELTGLASRYSFDQLEDILRQIIETERMLSENLNVKIALTLLKETIWAR